ncbi:dynein heavy chain 1, axonemal-like isoform X2 [Cimex lectularius]|nr:dynein heavy chain 1, axonemal-like isoform X2 [Cimex lectularius]
MDLHSQIEQIMEKCTYSQELEFELSRQYTLLDEYQYIIPEVTNIGPFAIVTAKIKYYLLEKRTELINGLLNAYSAKLRKKTKEIIAKYNETYQKVQEKTRNIEHLVNQREWMETIPRYFSEIEESIYRHLKEYDIFDRFHHNLLDEDLNMKWMVIGWPEKILEAIHDQQEIFDDDIAVFRKIQSEDEVAIQERIEHLSKSIAAVQLQDEKTKVHEIAQEVSKIWKLLRDTVDWGRVLNNRQRLFGDKVTPFTELTTLTKTFTPFKNLWATASDWLQTADMFLDNPIMNIDPSTIEGIVNEHAKTMTKCIKLFSEIPACLKIAETIKELIEEFKPHIPIIQALCAKGMRKRHWEEFQTMTGIPINWTPALTYKECINLGVHECGEALVVISDQAKKEYVIEVAIDKMVAEWENCLAQFSPFKNSDTYIFKLSDEVFQMLEDHIETTQSLQFSPSKGPFEGILEEWAKKLTMTQKILEKWVLCQQNFMYLYPIFTSVDISTQLVHESKKFANVLRMWRKLMTDFRANPQVMNACCDHKVHDLIGNCIRAMNLILSGLNQYLHIKRNGFPRFYFLSDEELVEILSKCSDPLAVQPHLKKCFENIYSLSFDSKNNITAMFSGEDEEVKLKYELKPTGSVDNWLSDVERLMRETIQTRIIGALNAFTQKKVKSDRNSWVLNWPGQVIIVSSQIIWTNNVEICITKGNLHSYYVTQLGYLDNLRSLIRGELTKLQRLSVSALIVIDVHARDVTEMLLKKIILDVHEFDWSKQLRFYFIQNTVALRAINAEFPYGYEYLGNTGRLVITPLTDRCYLTLIGALHLKFGGAPAGPAGTGKTETTKDLAKAFAVQCVVFNCSDQLNFMAMGKFFKGLATCGAWACFDEFNRIDIEVLSVVAQQITTIQRAQMARQETFIFEGEEISLKPSCAVFVTMNPGYAGRTELPDNLKALFRPVAMMVPDYTLIAEISLFSFGFTEARLLAAKITSTFKLSSEQLSTQDHYDFGMRAVKTVIAVAGNLKKEDPQFNETLIVLRALKDVNIPKFLSDDLKLFTNILSDLFPNVVDPPIDYGVFQKTIEHILDSMILYKSPQYIIKVIQLYDTTVVRHGLMLVGPAGTGKTRCYRVLQSVMGKLKGTNSHSGGTFQNVEVSIINPKAINMGQIYGEYDLQNHEWSDGVLAKFMREGAAAADEIKRWYMFDGPVDAVWIENMNTLLDDNKKLCLTSGEIIKMTDKMTMMFEVSDLSVASPATVSRCGMVYLEPSMITLDMLINCWSKSIPKDASHISISLDLAIRRYMLPAISFLRSNLHEIVKSTDCGLMSSALKLIGYFLRPFAPEQGKMPPADKVQVHLKKLATMWVIWSTIWSIGATCNLNEREKFSVLMNKLIHKNDKELKFPKFFVYDYWIHDGGFSMLTDSGDLEKPRWMHWLANVPLYEIPPASRFIDIEVPTIDSIRNATVLGKLIENNQHVLVIGPTGSGKTITILSKINRNMPEQFVSDFMTFTAKTSLNQTRDTIESKLEKRKKLVLGPPVGKKGILFIDDFNMPAIEKFGAQPPLELIRQYMDFGGWYDTKIVGAFKHVDDMCLIGAMGPPGGGRNKISERLVRHFHLLAYPEFSHNCRKIIFGTILNYWMANMRGFLKVGEKILDMTLKLYNVIEKELLPTPKKTHYTYNLRDLSRVFQGILLANSDDIKTIEELLVLWIHECTRVFSDRLINNEDKQWFKKKIRHEIDEAFQMDYNFLTTHDPILFGDFMSFLDTSNYVQITDFEKLSSVMNSYLQSYNKTSTAPMSLVLFMDAIEHVCRIVRIIKQPQTNGLLLGIGGSGRRSLTKLSAFMTDHTCVTVEPTRSYGVAEWRDDLKKMMYYSGVNNRETVFLFSDSQIIHESFLEDINSMLNTGDVPNIYLPEDLDKIYAAMRNVVIDSGLAVTKANLFSHYLKSARTNLHIIFTMSPIGENFRSRLRQFPALINCCTIDWFNLWPDTALETVAAQYVKTCGYFTNESNELIDGVVHSCKFIHLSVVKMADLFFEEYGRRTYISPTKYLILLHTYVNLMFKTRNSDEELLGRYHTGLEKLLISAEEVNELREAIKDMQPVLKESRRRAMEVAEKIDNDRMEAEKTKVIVAEEEAKAQVAQEETTQYAAETEKDLEKAMPTLRKAEAALMSINKKDITEVKAMKRPPAPVVLVMEVLCLIKNIPPNKIPGKLPGERVWDYWEPARNMLSDPGLFLKSLLEFDRDSMTEETIKKIEPYIKNPKFTAKNIKAASIACKSLFTWISAIYDYYFINKTVAPKRAAYNEAKNKLEECQRALERSRFRMKKVMDGLVELEARLAKTQARVQTLEENEQNGIMKLELAEELLVSLDDEKKRWIENASQITSSALTQIGNLLICAATVAYFGPFSDDYRRALQIEWTRTLTALKVPNDSDLEPVHILSNPLEIRRWQLSGLPKDFSSTENAILSSSSLRFPLFIDPTGQANKWIKGTLRETRLIVQKFGTKELMRELEGAISFGRTILIENIGLDIDPILDPILNKQIFPYRGNDCVKFGENIIPFNDRFMIYFTTRLRNPTYSPEICSKVNIINFTLSIGGLEDQLLSLVVSCKRPDLEEQKSRLVESTAEMKIEIKNLEDKILNLISSATGSPLDDLNLIEALKQSKEKSENIREKVDVASKTAKSIDETRIGYAPVARRAQILYFCLADMAKVDPMYQYSLDWFTNIFTLSLTQTEKSTNSEERNISVNNHFTYSLFMNVSRSLFEKNRLQFTFLICIRIMIEKKQITKEEFEFFLTGGKPKKTIPAPSGFPEQRWMEILGLETLPQFEVLINTIVANSDEWKFLIDDPNPYKQHFPMSFHLKLSVFQRLMLIRFARPDKLIDSIQDYISSHIGTKYIEPLPKNVASLYTDSTPLTPLLFVLSPGTDPAADFLSFAEKQSMVKKVMAISLGQGQGPIAEEMFNKAVQIGGWIFFQNCHLAPSWMPRLEQLIEGLPFDFVHKDFRIWLTSTPSEYFPSSILENGNKMTIEPPRGVKANLLRAYTGHVMEYQDFINSEEPKAPIFKGLLFALCLFHAIVLERRKFGPLGFNIPYEFTDGDLRISINQLHMFVMEYESIPYKVLSHTAGDINYGGRVTDDWDRRCIRCLLSEFYNPKTQTENYMFDLFAYYYQLPFNSQLSNYMAYIKELPINDETTLFGLHSNANISYSQGEASEAIKMLLSLQPQKTGKAAATQDAKVAVIAKETLLTVPGPFMDLDKIQEKYPVMYEESLNTVLYQEILRYNRLLFVIQESCHDLLKALDGVVVMSEHLEKMSQSLYLNQVPEMWAIKCYPSLMPLAAWCKDLKKRIRFLKKWIDSGRPANFWISGFFFPQAFLTAILQNYARTHIVSVDAISYLFIFLDELPRERKADGCVIYGLFLEGARWIQEKYKLSESMRKILFTEMSPIWLRPNENVIKDVVQVYNCPVYKTLKRVGTLSTTGHSTNYVLTIDLPTKKTNAHWVLRGVALFCALDYC